MRKRLSKSSSDEEERFYNLRSQGPVPDPDPETPVEKTIHETEPESESDTEETTTKKMPRVKTVNGKIIVKERTFGLKCCHKKSPRKCSLCDKKFHSQKELNQHAIDDHNYKFMCTK